MGHDGAVTEKTLHDQTNILPRAQLLIVFSTLAVTLLICFIDQNGISVALPTIAEDLNAQQTVSWAGTSSLIANTVFQMIYGRLVSTWLEGNFYNLENRKIHRQLTNNRQTSSEGRQCTFVQYASSVSQTCCVVSRKIQQCSTSFEQ